jgi:iron complex transport system ATP-binding protein
MVAVLRADGLSFTYPEVGQVLDGIDLAIEGGELVVLLGPNGSGKSTLLKLLGGILRVQVGRVELNGEPIAGLGHRRRARCVASVPQRLNAMPQVRVRDFVLGGRYPHRPFLGGSHPGDGAALELALAEADVAGLTERLLGELSGGQFQRVLLARALAQEAGLLLFDEPTASLDPEHQVRVFELIARSAARGLAALVATHEMHLAGRFASRLLLLDRGRIAAQGAPEEVLRPEVLEPVYGRDLMYLEVPGAPSRPLVLPWPQGGSGAG